MAKTSNIIAPVKERPITIKKIADNRSARHDYFIEDEVEAGIELMGTEVKSLRAGKLQLAGSYARLVVRAGALTKSDLAGLAAWYANRGDG